MSVFTIPKNNVLYDSAPCDGRLTLTSGLPVTVSNVLNATTVYFTPYQGDTISLYNGTIWRNYRFNEISIAVPSSTSTNYDVFVYDNAGTLTLETTAWTNDSTRATVLVLQNGVYVKSGVTTRRYLGTFRTTTTTGQTEDSTIVRYLWNYYNRCFRSLNAVVSASHTYTTGSWRSWNNSTALGSTRNAFVIGVAELAIHFISHFNYVGGGSKAGWSSLGFDTTSASSSNQIYNITSATTANIYGPASTYVAIPVAGLHYIQALQYGASPSLTYLYVQIAGTLFA